jgi:hypothetical protein
MNSDDLMAIMKAQQDSYLSAYNAGYSKGFEDACKQALEIVNKPKRNYTKQEKST